MNDTPENRQAIQPLLHQIATYTLSQFDGKMKTKDWKKAPSFPVPSPQIQEDMHWVNPESYLAQLPEVLNNGIFGADYIHSYCNREV